jgi:hypothetical protein
MPQVFAAWPRWPLERLEPFRLGPLNLDLPLCRKARLDNSIGMFAERAIRSNGASQNDARFGERGHNDRGIIGFLCKALVEKVRVRTPGFQSRLHRWRSNGEIEEPERGLIGFNRDRSGKAASNRRLSSCDSHDSAIYNIW